MFERVHEAIKKLLRASSIDKETIDSVIHDIKISLIEADVDLKIVEELTDRIKSRIKKVPPGLTLREYLIKTIYEELVELLGKEFYPVKGKKIMLIGLFGSGKTTTAAKLAYYFKKQGKKVLLVGLDYHRPAAPQQIKQLGEKVGVKVLIDSDPFSVARESLKQVNKYDVVIYDTAGRNALDEELAKELKKLGELIKPEEVLLVIPADIGKIAGKQAEEFNNLVGITGIVVTKIDSTAKGGGALAAASVTGAKIKFIGTGEKPQEIEKYDPKRFVSRLIGLGDLETLLEKAKESVKPEKVEKIIGGEFTLSDFMEQLESMRNIGPLQQIISMIPGIGMKVPKELIKKEEEKMKKWKYIIQSMTPEERNNPEIINESRINRIARGSGTSPEEVRELLRQYFRMRKMIKTLGGFKGLKRGQLQQLLKRFGMG